MTSDEPDIYNKRPSIFDDDEPAQEEFVEVVEEPKTKKKTKSRRKSKSKRSSKRRKAEEPKEDPVVEDDASMETEEPDEDEPTDEEMSVEEMEAQYALIDDEEGSDALMEQFEEVDEDEEGTENASESDSELEDDPEPEEDLEDASESEETPSKVEVVHTGLRAPIEDGMPICTKCGAPIDTDDLGTVARDADGNALCPVCACEHANIVVKPEPEDDMIEPEDEELPDILDLTKIDEDDHAEDEESSEEPEDEDSEESEEPIQEDEDDDEPKEDEAEEQPDAEEPVEDGDDEEPIQEDEDDDEPKEDEAEEEPEPEPKKKSPKQVLFGGLRRKTPEEQEKEREEIERRKKKKASKPVDPDKLTEKIRRWWLVHFRNYVKLRTLYRNNRTGEFVSETTLVKKKDLPHDAVKCTGEMHYYCLDLIKDSDWYIKHHYKNMGLREYQFTASDACLYMLTNKIDNALALQWESRNPKDWTKIILLLGVGLVVILIMIMRLM